VFQGFGPAKFPYGGLVLGSSQFSLLLQPPQKMTLNLKVIKFDSKINQCFSTWFLQILNWVP